jgi:peptide/nickel transport system permease protein
MSSLSTPTLASPPVIGRKKRDVAYLLSLGFLMVVAAAALLAPWAAPYAANAVDFTAIWQGPGSAHLLGTDQVGQDLLSRLIHGARESLLGPLALLALATVFGVTIGIVAAWNGGWIDVLLARITDVMFAFPGLLFVVLVIAVFGKGPATAIVALALAYAPVIAKFTRSLALAEIARPYVDAYRVQGVGGAMLCLRYIVPNLAPPLLGYLVVLFGEGLMSLATLSFLGFGAQPPSSEWGLMVQEGQSGIIQGHVWPTLVPGVAIAAVVVAVNVVGVRLSDRLNSRFER